MTDGDTVFTRLQAVLQSGTVKQRIVAGHILANLRDCSYMSTRRLATDSGVDPATVVRLSKRLGFDRYDAFRQSLRAYYLSSLEPIDLLEEHGSSLHTSDLVDQILRQEFRSLSLLMKSIDQSALLAAANDICKARRIVIAGSGEAGGIATAMGHLLAYLGLNVVTETRGGLYLGAQVANLACEDLIVLLSFWRPSADVVHAAQWGRDSGVPTILITDSITSRVSAYAGRCIIAPCEAISFFQSMTAALSVVHVIVAMVAATLDGVAGAAIRRSRAFNREYGVVLG